MKPTGLLNGATGVREPLQNLLDKLSELQATSTGWRARCPACGQTAGLSIERGEPAVLCCSMGCAYYDAILLALRLPPSHEYRGAPVNTPRRRAI